MRSLTLYCLLLLTLATTALQAQQPYRIGYFEGGYFHTYQPTYKALRQILVEKGWNENYIQFVEDAHFSPGFDSKGKQEWNAVAQHLLERDDLDMLLLGGTAATNVMLRYSYPEVYCQTAQQKQEPACQGILSLSQAARARFILKPMMAASVSDAVKAGFVVSQEQHHQGVENLMVRVVPNRYSRMFEIFYHEVEFTKLGLLYVDTPSGRTYTNLEDAHSVAQRYGFEIVEQTVSTEFTDAECQAAIKSLVEKGIDAFFIPSLTCFEWQSNHVETLLSILFDNKVKTFARQGSKDVQAGAMMSLSSIDFSGRANFLAERIIKVIEGQSPHQLNMVDTAPPKIAVNLTAANYYGHDFSLGILGASEEIYRDIVLPNNRRYE